MSTITDPIMLDSTGQAIKNSIDLLSANINRTASNIPYDSNITVKAAIDGKVSKSGDTMSGNLYVQKANSGTSLANSEVVLGNNIAEGTASNSRGVLRLFGTGTQRVSLFPRSITAERDIVVPDGSGSMMVLGPTSSYVKSASGTGGSYPVNQLFICNIYQSGSNGNAVTAFLYSTNLNKRVSIDSSHYVYFNKQGQFDMSTLENDSIVAITPVYV